jgi:hypothetical protein
MGRENMSADKGIYLYAIGRASDSSEIQLDQYPEVYPISAEDLVAYARVVSLSEYSEEALKERADDQAWLIAEVQQHHAVIAELHQQAPVLPAKFGSAYASEDAVRDALKRSLPEILKRLDVLEDCDEWAAHVYLVDRDLTQAALARDPELSELAARVEQASEGVKYMLRQRLQSRLKEAIEQFEMELAQEALDGLHQLTEEFQVEPPREGEQTPEGEPEIARASMLVQRDRVQEFIDQAEETNRAIEAVWLKITGPWPAYSFAQFEIEEESVTNG